MELLRIIAMLMVLTMHYLSASNALIELEEKLDVYRVVASFLESFSLVAVNVYVLISGYYNVKSGFRIKRVVNLFLQVVFYTLLLSLLLQALSAAGVISIARPDAYQMITWIFPISSGYYWFMTAYLVMYLFTPVLNAAVLHMPKERLQIVIAGLLFIFSIVKSFVPAVTAFDRFGYDFGWFLCLYLLAAYIRCYGLFFLKKKSICMLLYVVSATLSFFIVLACKLAHDSFGGLNYFFTVPNHYNFILCLLASIGLFGFFRLIILPEGKTATVVRKISPYLLGVYLFHEQVGVQVLWKSFFRVEQANGSLMLFPKLVVAVLSLFVVGLLVDWIRVGLYKAIGSVRLVKRLSDRIEKLDHKIG